MGTSEAVGTRPHTDLSAIAATARWSLRLAFHVSTRLTLVLIGLPVLQALVPAGLLLAVRGLINEAAHQHSLESGAIEPILPWLGLGLGLGLLEATARAFKNLTTLRLRDELHLHATQLIMEHADRLQVAYFESADKRDDLERAQREAGREITSFLTSSTGALTGLLQLLTLIAILAAIEPLVLVVVAVAALPNAWFQWRVSKEHYELRHARSRNRRWTRYFISCFMALNALVKVKLFSLGPLLRDRFRVLLERFRDEDYRLYVRRLKGTLAFVVFVTLAFYAVFFQVLIRFLSGGVTIGDVAVFGGGTGRLRGTLEGVTQGLVNASRAMMSVANLMHFLAVPVSARDAGDTPIGCEGAIELEDVRFSYPGSSGVALDGVSFRIAAGETVAIVGENGAGKSTLVRLIARLYEPTSGAVRLDGRDLQTLSPGWVRSQIAYALQRPVRYEATAEENVAFGDPARLLDAREAVIDAAKRAGVHELILSFPRGYDTLLGRMFGNVQPSAGQWQRLGIARAMARACPILILDEPTAGLDARAEYRMFEQFSELARGRTTILISHRFSTVRIADRIVVLHEGRVVEDGTHEALLAARGRYARLFDLHTRQLQIETRLDLPLGSEA